MAICVMKVLNINNLKTYLYYGKDQITVSGR